MKMRILSALALSAVAAGCTGHSANQAALSVQQSVGSGTVAAISTGPAATRHATPDEIALLLAVFQPGMLPETW